MERVLPDGAHISDGRLSIGGIDAAQLAEDFGTPVIALDRATIESRAKSFISGVGSESVFYAGKAFMCVAMCELVDSLGLGIDVCTGGELRTALAAKFPPERIIFHGNNKSVAELKAAGAAGVGRIVADSFDELDRIESLGLRTRLMIRVTPGVEAHTHEFVQTGQEDSKFGFTLADGIALRAIERAAAIEGAGFVGLHAHIGSQIFEMAAFELAGERLAELAALARATLGVAIREVNVGGGLGIAHTHDEVTPDPAASVGRIASALEREFRARGLAAPAILVEPGRALVGAAGVTLYRVGTVKKIPGVRTYISVDGGMSDNIRPALYGARYEAFLAERAEAPVGPRVAVAGKHCESGDILIREVHLPEDVVPGDLLCIPATGAYAYAMASNYNRVPRPPVVLVSDGTATEIVARETEADLLRLDRHLDGGSLPRS